MSEQNVKLLGVVITAVSSLAVAILGFYYTRRTQRSLQEQVQKSQRELEDLQNKNREGLEETKDQIDQRKSERDALRDYQYDARKRLYLECGPLLFQLLELSEGGLGRIKSLARTASDGKLEKGSDNWLARPYYRASTLYKLIAPLAMVRLIQLRLTLIDLSLDRHIFLQYSLAKQIYLSFGDDFYFANAKKPPLPYDPHNQEAEVKRVAVPQKYWQQGIPIGILDNAVESLIATDAQGVARLKSFGEFEAQYRNVPDPPLSLSGALAELHDLLPRARQNESHSLSGAFNRIDYLVTDFHPADRPVLWRMLVTQAHLYAALIYTRDRDSTAPEQRQKLLEVVPLAARKEYDWRRASDLPLVEDELVLADPFQVAEKYLHDKLGPLFQKEE